MISAQVAMPLPKVLKPLHGESFVSLLERNAHYLDVPLINLMYRIGLVDSPKNTSLDNGYGVYLPANRKKTVSSALHITVGQLDRLLLEGFDGIVFSAPRLADGTLDVGKTRAGEWLYLSGSHVCPECVGEQRGAWRIGWKLPWMFSCERHSCLLASECPQCELRFGTWRRDRQIRPRFTGAVPVPGRCTNSMGGGIRGHQTGMCGLDISSLPMNKLIPGSVIISVQDSISRVIGNRSATLAGERINSVEYFRVLRGVVALLMYAATADDIRAGFGGEVVLGVQQSVDTWFVNRDAVLSRFESAAESGARSGKRQRIPPQKQTSFAPVDPALMAGLVVAAHHYLESESVAGVAKKMKPILELGRERGGGSSSLISRLGLPPFFAQLCAMNFPTRREYHFHPFRPALMESEVRQSKVTSKHVPQLFWAQIYEEQFSEYFSGMALRSETIRVALSVLFVALINRGARDVAISELGIQPQLRGGVDKTLLLLRQSGQADAVFAALHDLNEDPSRIEPLVDFAERRRLLQDLTEIPALDWASLASRMGVHPGKPGGRNVWAAAIVWETATGGDWRWAPALHVSAVDTASQRESLTRFRSELSSDALSALELYGQYILEGAKMNAQVGSDSQIPTEFAKQVVGGFEPRHVPQLYWDESYSREFRKFFTDLQVSDRVGRATVSVALLELHHSMPRVQLGALLGLDERMVAGGISAAIQQVRAGPDSEQFGLRIAEAAERLSLIPDKTDYHERRSQLANFVVVPWDEWRPLAKAAAINAGHEGIRNAHAATWLWTELTQGDYRKAPAYRELIIRRRPNFVYMIYAKFLKDTLPRVREPLLKWAEANLAT